MPRKKNPPLLENIGSLITYKHHGKDTCLGYVFHTPEHGVYDAAHGKVDVTPEQAEIHNKLLDQALINGLDTHCEVGQGGTFYLSDGQIKTWLGTVIAPALSRRGKHYSFVRGGKELHARETGGEDDSTVWLQRVS
jgi:hypothetical protein